MHCAYFINKSFTGRELYEEGKQQEKEKKVQIDYIGRGGRLDFANKDNPIRKALDNSSPLWIFQSSCSGLPKGST